MARRRNDDEDDYDDEDDRPRRRRSGDEDDYYKDDRRRRRHEGDATGGLIPYKNAKALAAYYCGVFGLIPCVGGILGVIAVVLGVLGLGHAKQYPKAGGVAHAYVGIVLGVIEILAYLVAPVVFIIVAAATK